jgi:VanZ family protein
MMTLLAWWLGPPRAALRRAGFILYALALFTGTHWPALDVRSDVIQRPDLLAHFVIFALWALALWQSGLAGDPALPRTIPRCVLIGVVYAAIDEALQAIPILRRNAALDDYAFNVIGVLIGAAIAWTLARALPPRPPARPSAHAAPRF